MKKTYAILSVMVICILLICAGINISNRGKIKISYTENKEHILFAATYPAKISDAVINYVHQWASQATQRSGELSGTLKVKFSNGVSCRLHAKGRDLEIIADRADNDLAAQGSLKGEFNAINTFVLAQSSESLKRRD